jgi:hypothetical protein
MKYPEFIYKYKRYDNAIEIVRDDIIYVPQPSQLNDPFESDIKIDLSELKKTDVREEYVNHIINKFEFQIKYNNLNKNELREHLFNKTIPDLVDSYIRHREDLYYKDYSNFGILSLTDKYDDIVMWSHYADMHKGMCIKFNTEKLIHSGLFETGCIVFYQDKFPTLDLLNLVSDDVDINIKLLILLFFNKHISWKYENEYRLIKIFGYHIDNEEFKKQRKVKFRSDTIEEVILGSNFPKEKLNEVKSICKEKGILLSQMINVPFQFKLNKIEISN